MATNYDFKEVSMGNGDLWINGVNVGFTKGNSKYKYNYDIEKFKTGVPRKFRGQQAKEVSATLTCGLAQFSPSNVSIALGGLEIVNNNGAETEFAGTGANAKSRTFAAGYLGMGTQSILLEPFLTDANGKRPVVKNAAETVTYTEGVDYIVIYNLGVIILITGGDIAEDQVVHITSMFYTVPTSKQINLGAVFALAEVTVKFIHTRPKTGKDIETYMHLASVDGAVDVEYAEEDWIVNQVTFEAIADESNNPVNPFGYIRFY